jgi:hypothetical protein
MSLADNVVVLSGIKTGDPASKEGTWAYEASNSNQLVYFCSKSTT